ncbi:MAG: hypothetical protein K0S51_2417 [Bacillales bacterium]|jgi:restriction endonuclease S subunit|nr:hypothetical protein [Bacillales bacterium]
MKLHEIAELTQGAFINRIETLPSEDTINIKPLSLKEFNETLGVTYRISNERNVEITVHNEKIVPQLLTDTKSLILHTHTGKVAWLPDKFCGLLLTNNFIKIKFLKNVDEAFFEWYFNEHPFIQKQLAVLSERSVISLLKISHLKDIEVNLPPFQKQIIIGKIAQLKKKKESLMIEKRELQQLYVQHKLIQSVKAL